jgi:hypothetical protein
MYFSHWPLRRTLLVCWGLWVFGAQKQQQKCHLGDRDMEFHVGLFQRRLASFDRIASGT